MRCGTDGEDPLTATVADICRRIPGKGGRSGRFWRVPCRGGALQVLLEGETAGTWVNTATGARGDLIDLRMMAGGEAAPAECARAPESARHNPKQCTGEQQPGPGFPDIVAGGLAALGVLMLALAGHALATRVFAV
ncbi:MAG: hypothetical protein OXE86_16055 [Alphaproteobacteria bacterium]|nr:hypothetical protein [Alphaproteobacteria bacterium]